MNSKVLIVTGVVIFLLIVLFPFWYMRGKAAPPPEVELTPKAKAAQKCVRSTEYMQAEHMQLLDIWRGTGTAILVVTHSIPEAVFLGQKVLMLQAHPGRVKDIVEIGLPSERQISLRETPEFNTYCSQLRRLLEEC